MSSSSRNIFIFFLLLTIILLVMEAVGIDGNALVFTRYMVVIILSTTAYIKKGAANEQKILFMSFPLMIIGDFFLVLSYSLGDFPQELRYFGFIPFTIAYLLIAGIYIRGFKWSSWLVLPTMVYGLLLVVIAVLILPYMDGVQTFLASVVALTLTAMAWAGVSSIWNGYYGRRTSIMMALSGLLMLLCDYGVALDLFYPDIWRLREVMVINPVWLTYVPGWTILALVVMEREFHTHVYE
ncbi:MAG: hypothetical protein NUK57_07700 [Gudongella sp.]|nr:hypothetical protein [Gudongella sp.]